MANRREKSKYSSLDRSLNTKVRRYCIEPDYINGTYNEHGKKVIRELNEEELAWLNKFYEEYVVTKFSKDGPNFYNKDEERRELYNANNARNRCLFTQYQAQGKLVSTNQVPKVASSNLNPEEILMQREDIEFLEIELQKKSEERKELKKKAQELKDARSKDR